MKYTNFIELLNENKKNKKKFVHTLSKIAVETQARRWRWIKKHPVHCPTSMISSLPWHHSVWFSSGSFKDQMFVLLLITDVWELWTSISANIQHQAEVQRACWKRCRMTYCTTSISFVFLEGLYWILTTMFLIFQLSLFIFDKQQVFTFLFSFNTLVKLGYSFMYALYINIKNNKNINISSF